MGDDQSSQRSGREQEASVTTPTRGAEERAPDRKAAEATKEQPGVGGQPRPLLGEPSDEGDDADTRDRSGGD